MPEKVIRKRKTLSELLSERSEQLLDAERELQTAKLELEEKERLIQSLTSELQRQDKTHQRRASDLTDASLEKLFDEAATAAAQILTQEHLLSSGAQLPARDLLNVSRTLIRTLEKHGLELQGQIGAQVEYDQNLHQSIELGLPIKNGECVVVRMIGVTYKGKVLRRAAVTRVVVIEEEKIRGGTPCS